MPSQSLEYWLKVWLRALDEIERAHRSVGGTGPGRRHAAQQINQAYAVLLSAQFQGFCRDLHDECADRLVQLTTPVDLWETLKDALVWNRKLDSGNANPGNIGSDFNRLKVKFWVEVRTVDARNQSRFERLDDLSRWRNAIAHQDFDPGILGSGVLRLETVQGWRSACEGLAISFDRAMRVRLREMIGTPPW